MAISELKLAKELIRRPSITPKDAGAINVLTKSLRSLGFKCQTINFKNVKNLEGGILAWSKKINPSILVY